ncbi:MAG: M28 family peptidase [Deltaproteobacteria bacterium]|nr:M28 family peptidase [Deltaproteobacteria bacterium]
MIRTTSQRAFQWIGAYAALLILAGCSRAPNPNPLPQEGQAAVSRITAARLSDHIRALSGDEYEGRGPATAGDLLTQQYLADQLDAIGLEPGGPGDSWVQEFDVVGITSEVPKSWSFQRGTETLTIDYWEQFIAASGVQHTSSKIENAEVVFVGYGIDAPEYAWNDFKEQDVNGKILLIVNNDPNWDPELFEGDTRLYYGRWDYKYATAARHGAAGAIIIHTIPSAGYPWQVVQTSWSGEQFELPASDAARLEIAAWVTEDVAADLVGLAGKDLAELVESAKSRDFQPVALGVTTSLAFENKLSQARTANVIGRLPGSDPALSDEVVIFTAHHDHLGIGTPDESGDSIYNGALDNAAGVAQVLAIADALHALPVAPRRSTLFLFVAGEEQGLLGSKYYAAHPTYAPGKIAANINYDGGNIWGKVRDITFIGLGKSSLDAVVKDIAASQGRVVKPDQFPDRGYYYRSDQFSFANIGVPATFFDTGTDFIGRPAGWGKEQMEQYEEVRYHQPSDEFDDSWNFEGMIEDASIGFWTALSVANTDAMPSWNPGDEFEAVRKAALEAVSDQ